MSEEVKHPASDGDQCYEKNAAGQVREGGGSNPGRFYRFHRHKTNEPMHILKMNVPGKGYLWSSHCV
jgi:hypothetical protein